MSIYGDTKNSLVKIIGQFYSRHRTNPSEKKLLLDQLQACIDEYYAYMDLMGEKPLQAGNGSENEQNKEEFRENSFQEIRKIIDKALSTGSYPTDTMQNVLAAFNKTAELTEVLTRKFDGHTDTYRTLKSINGFSPHVMIGEPQGNQCHTCAELDGSIYLLKHENGKIPAKLHPNCRCFLAPLDLAQSLSDNDGGTEPKTDDNSSHWYDPLLRIPDDAVEYWKALVTSQDKRFRNIKNPIDLLDWLTYGGVVASQQRVDAMKDDPSLFNIGNYVTGGVVGTLEKTFNPDEPLSLEHWLNSLGTAGLLLGAYKTAQAKINADLPDAAIKNAYKENVGIDSGIEKEGKGKTGKFIDNTTDAMSKGEKQVVDDLVGQGKTVERIPRDSKAIDKTPDFKVDGVKTELKTLQNANTTTGVGRVQQGFKQGAETVIIDARGSGLTWQQAQEIINRSVGTYPNKVIPGKVEIWIDGHVITYP